MNTKLLSSFGLILAASLSVGACGGGGGESADPGKALNIVLVDQQFAAPAMVDASCVIFAPALTAEELRRYTSYPANQTFRHIGASVRQCLSGEAKSYISAAPPHYFTDTLFYTYDGDCPEGARSCFYYYTSNAVIDVEQAYNEQFAKTQDNEDALMGHETYHAVAGSFHD